MTDQVLYNLAQCATSNDLLPWCREKNIPIMAYSPSAPISSVQWAQPAEE